jgi:hypothetical protein
LKHRGPRVFAITVREPAHDPRVIVVDRFPFVVGRAHDASLRLEGSGVWNQHLILELNPHEGLVATPGGGALVTLQGSSVSRHRVRNGDEMTLGSVLLQFVLSPAPRRRTGHWEAAVWLVLGAVAMAQVIIAWRILDLP